jgi:hypothetical protein
LQAGKSNGSAVSGAGVCTVGSAVVYPSCSRELILTQQRRTYTWVNSGREHLHYVDHVTILHLKVTQCTRTSGTSLRDVDVMCRESSLIQYRVGMGGARGLHIKTTTESHIGVSNDNSRVKDQEKSCTRWVESDIIYRHRSARGPTTMNAMKLLMMRTPLIASKPDPSNLGREAICSNADVHAEEQCPILSS